MEILFLTLCIRDTMIILESGRFFIQKFQTDIRKKSIENNYSNFLVRTTIFARYTLKNPKNTVSLQSVNTFQHIWKVCLRALIRIYAACVLTFIFHKYARISRGWYLLLRSTIEYFLFKIERAAFTVRVQGHKKYFLILRLNRKNC